MKIETPLPLSNKNILVAEDNEDIVALIKHFITKAGGEIFSISNGLEATTAAFKTHFDAILLDINMPILDGRSAAQRIRQNGYKGPIIALTAHSLEQELIRRQASDFNLFVQKPFSNEHLVECIESAIQNQDLL